MVRLYLDPGSGSILIQLLVAGIAGAAIFIASSWRKIKRLFTKKGQPETTIEEDDDQDDREK